MLNRYCQIVDNFTEENSPIKQIGEQKITTLFLIINQSYYTMYLIQSLLVVMVCQLKDLIFSIGSIVKRVELHHHIQ